MLGELQLYNKRPCGPQWVPHPRYRQGPASLTLFRTAGTAVSLPEGRNSASVPGGADTLHGALAHSRILLLWNLDTCWAIDLLLLPLDAVRLG